MNSKEKIIQKLMKFGLPILAIVAFILFIAFSTDDEVSQKTSSEYKPLSLFDEEELVKSRYMDSISGEIDDVKKNDKASQDEISKLKEEMKKLKEEMNKNDTQNKNTTTNLYNNFPSPAYKGLPDEMKNSSLIPSGSILSDQNSSKPKTVYKVLDIDKDHDIDENFGKVLDPNHNKDNNQSQNKKDLYIPPTSFTIGTLMHGINAPTSMSRPMPSFVIIKDLMFLPNRKELDLQECRAGVEGWGKLSDERVYFKLINFACINKDNEILEAEVNGYITSLSDNKQGLPGHVVSKQSDMLKRMFIAGMFEGASDLFKQSNQTNLITSSGTITQTTENDKDELAEGLIAGGLSKASESAKELYLEKAKNIQETIEVLAQDVGIVFTKGTEMKIVNLEDGGKKNESN